MNILVTGGAGYIGSSLVPVLLAGGHRVRVFDSLLHGGESMLGFWLHPAFELIHGDIRDRDAVRAAVAGMDGVVHLAAIVGDPACARQPDQAREVNLDASISLVEECHRSNVSRFIFASTCSNYGRMSDPSGYVDETSELRPVSLYAETKVAIERMLLQNKGSFAPTLMRFATIFGVSPRMRFDLTVNEFTMEMITKNHLVVFGEQFWRPYVHVHDAGRAILTVLQTPTAQVAGCVFNVGDSEQNLQKQQLVEMIRPYAPQAVVEFVHKAEDPRDYRVSFTRIREKLGFKITRTVEQGIQEVAYLVRSNVIGNYADARYRN